MFIPLGTDRANKRPTMVTYALIALNVLVFGVLAVLDRTQPDLALQVRRPLPLDPEDWRLWQFFTYQFVHGGVMHLLGNMVFLLVFGPGVEDRLRRLGFLVFYLLGGAFAGLCHMLLGAEVVDGPNGAHWVIAARPVIGASGSVSCVTGAFLVLFPLTNIKVILWFIVIGATTIPSWMLISLSIVKDLFLEGFGASKGVAHLAHLGGYFYGASIALILLWTKVLPREVYDLLSIWKHAQRRRKFKELATSGKESPWRADQVRGVMKSEETPDERTELATQVMRLMSARDLDGAAHKYGELILLEPNVSFPREMQLELANHCYSIGKYREAAAAYGTFLAKRADDRDAERARLMLAILSARYLGDPAKGRELLGTLVSERLSEDERSVAEQLRAEVS